MHCVQRSMDASAEEQGRAERGGPAAEGLPPPPLVPQGAVPAKMAGDGGTNGGSKGGAGRGSNGASGSTAMAALALADVPVFAKASRPGYGRAGRPTQLCVNHFKATLVKWDDVYHYNVSRTFPLSILLSSGLLK